MSNLFKDIFSYIEPEIECSECGIKISSDLLKDSKTGMFLNLLGNGKKITFIRCSKCEWNFKQKIENKNQKDKQKKIIERVANLKKFATKCGIQNPYINANKKDFDKTQRSTINNILFDIKRHNKKFIIIGNPGSGKTHLASYIMMRSFCENPNLHHSMFKYARFYDILLSIRNSFSNKIDNEMLEITKLTKPWFLILELCQFKNIQKYTIYSKDFSTRVLFKVTDDRSSLPTIYISTISKYNMYNIFDSSIVDRIFQNAQIITMQTRNFRVKQ